jgi:ligand-binding sensor domain-containing protein
MRPRASFTWSAVRLASALCLAGAAAPARAERLATKTFTATEGLAHDRVHHISQDSAGFLWFSTADGLSRFDGEHFVNYGVLEGLLLGLLGAAAVARWLAALLFGVAPLDPLTHAHAHSSLLLVSLVASLIPALRAARLDPLLALRED